MSDTSASEFAKRLRYVTGLLGRAVHGAYYYVPILHRRTEPLLILGHMRCGSTLLAHILNSHPEVAGYGETHRSYRCPRDVLGLRAHVFVRQPTLRVRARYVSDKNVNELFPVDPEVLAASSARVVLIAREPRASMSSLLRVLSDWTEQQALGHYLTRMELLQRTAACSDRERLFFLTHHQLLHHSDAVLEALTRFLGLRTRLSSRYEVTERTGQWGWGDTTERIWAGRIVRDYERPERDWPVALITRAESAYLETVGALEHLASHARVPLRAREDDRAREDEGAPYGASSSNQSPAAPQF